MWVLKIAHNGGGGGNTQVIGDSGDDSIDNDDQVRSWSLTRPVLAIDIIGRHASKRALVAVCDVNDDDKFAMRQCHISVVRHKCQWRQVWSVLAPEPYLILSMIVMPLDTTSHSFGYWLEANCPTTLYARRVTSFIIALELEAWTIWTLKQRGCFWSIKLLKRQRQRQKQTDKTSKGSQIADQVPSSARY